MKQVCLIRDYCLIGLKNNGTVITVSKHLARQRLLRSLKSTHKLFLPMNCKVVNISSKSASSEMKNLEKHGNFHCLSVHKYYKTKEENNGWYGWDRYILKYSSMKINVTQNKWSQFTIFTHILISYSTLFVFKLWI